MPPGKAAKKVAKKAAKKIPAKGPAKIGKDTRRAYEHLGRVQVLVERLGPEQSDAVQVLVKHAEVALRDGDSKSGADLLRAAEHLGFGTLAMQQPADETSSEMLLTAVREEFDHLREKAQEAGEAVEAPRAVAALYKRMAKGAAAAMRSRQFRAALEMARGAEALTQVAAATPKLPGKGEEKLRAGR